MNDPRPDRREPPPALVRRARDGDREAREQLVRRVYPLVLRWSRVRCADESDAEDVAHDALVRALRGLPTFDGRARFTTWLYRIVHNVAVDRGRRRSTRRGKEEDVDTAGALVARGPDPAEEAERSELLERIDAAFRALPERQREVFDMADLQGLTSPEIAERLGVTPSTVRVTLLHARRAVRSAVLGCVCGVEEGP